MLSVPTLLITFSQLRQPSGLASNNVRKGELLVLNIVVEKTNFHGEVYPLQQLTIVFGREEKINTKILLNKIYLGMQLLNRIRKVSVRSLQIISVMVCFVNVNVCV